MPTTRSATASASPSSPTCRPARIKWELLLKTNDLTSPHVPVLVEATVQASLSVNPGAVNLGNPKVGELITRRIVVSGSKPFKITEIEGAGDGIQAELPATSASPAIPDHQVSADPGWGLQKDVAHQDRLGE